jgi:hypothetical protein
MTVALSVAACDLPLEAEATALQQPLIEVTGGEGDPAIGEAPLLGGERRGIGLEEVGPTAAADADVDTRKSLFITEQSIVSGFTLQAVMDKLAGQNGGGISGLQLFRQLWGTQLSPPAGTCSTTLNGFPFTCPRAEGNQATTDPFVDPNADAAYIATALVNRFDLAATDGADCGEYRIIFARRSGINDGGNRAFMIFEAVLPNPRRDLGIQGCRPVQNFWRDLSRAGRTEAQRRTALLDFYLQGLPGFLPVVHIRNYGVATGADKTGQIRTNQFMQSPWMLREFKLRRTCATSPCQLTALPVTDKTNPAPQLFQPGPTLTAFQQSVVNQVPQLALNDLNRFNYVVADNFNIGESNSQDIQDDYLDRFGPGPSTFRTAIQNRLNQIGADLTPDHIVDRALSLACAGCHQLSVGRDLGGGLQFPGTLGFVHVGEFLGGDGRFPISDALTTTFLPHRERVMESFLNTNRPFEQALINFQPASAPPFPSFLVDGGATFGVQQDGLSYGWNTSHTARAVDRNNTASPDQRFDTFIQMTSTSRWELQVPNGVYRVRIVAGDPNTTGAFNISAEGTQIVSGSTTTTARWLDRTGIVRVSDGRLTVTGATGTLSNRINFIEVNVFKAFIDFRPSTGAGAPGYRADTGLVFGGRGSGFTFGWNTDNTANTRRRNSASSPGLRWDTLNHMQNGGNRTWEIAVPNGSYRVKIVAGDAGFTNSVYKIAAEGQLTVDGTPSNNVRWVEGARTVTVNDGRLTISNATGSVNNKICFVEIE